MVIASGILGLLLLFGASIVASLLTSVALSKVFGIELLSNSGQGGPWFSILIAFWMLTGFVAMFVAMRLELKGYQRTWTANWQVGDYVTRGDDAVFQIQYIYPDKITADFVCVRAPASGWCQFGSVEPNAMTRYSFIATNKTKLEKVLAGY